MAINSEQKGKELSVLEEFRLKQEREREKKRNADVRKIPSLSDLTSIIKSDSGSSNKQVTRENKEREPLIEKEVPLKTSLKKSVNRDTTPTETQPIKEKVSPPKREPQNLEEVKKRNVTAPSGKRSSTSEEVSTSKKSSTSPRSNKEASKKEDRASTPTKLSESTPKTKEESLKVEEERAKLRKETESKKPVRKNRNKDFQDARGIHKSLINECRVMFPDLTIPNAVSAYILVHSNLDKSGSLDGVPEEVQEAVIEYTSLHGDPRGEYFKEMSEALSRIGQFTEVLNRNLVQNASMTELALSYLVYDRLGFRDSTPSSPGAINFIESGVLDIKDKLGSDATKNRHEESIRKGRPIR